MKNPRGRLFGICSKTSITGLHNLKCFLLAFFVAAYVIVFCSRNAEATTYVMTATGTVAPGSPDPAGLFGGSVALGNQPIFTATFTFDSSLNTLDTITYAPGVAVLSGETSYSITINGYTVTGNGTGSGAALTLKDLLHLFGSGNSDSLRGDVTGTQPDGYSIVAYAGIASSANDFVPNLNPGQSISYALQSGDGWYFGFEGSSLLGTDNFSGYTNEITLNATPLPSTWFMLLSGFVGLGFVSHRGTKKSAAAIPPA